MRDEGAACVSVSRRFGVACVREPVGHCSRGSGREKWAPRSRPQVRSLPASICVRRPSPWRFDWERRMFSPSPRLSPASGSRPSAAPPTRPRFDQAGDDMRRLTVEIDHVLSGRPPPARSQQQSLSAALAVAGDDIELSIDGAETFARQTTGNRGEGVAEQAAGWLGRARRERRVERARSAISWILVVLFVALIAGASAYVVRGGLPEPAAIERALRSIGL